MEEGCAAAAFGEISREPESEMCALLVLRIENFHSIKRAGLAQLGKER